MPSGRHMVIDGVPRAINFTLNDTKTSVATPATNTRGGTERGGGIREWNGTFGARGGDPLDFMPNHEFTFEGYFAPDNGIEGGDGIAGTGPATIQQTVINWNWGTNERINWTANYQGGVGLTYPRVTPTLDNAASVDDFACGTFFEYSIDDGVTFIEIPALASATLTFTSALVRESNSSTRSGGDCFARYLPGIIDWTLSMVQQDTEIGIDGYPLLGDDVIFRCYTRGASAGPPAVAAQFFTLKYGRTEAYNSAVDQTTNTPIQRTINAAMQSNSPGVGHIYTPGQEIGVDQPWWGVQ